MTDTDELRRRLEAVERAVTDGTSESEHPPASDCVPDTAAHYDELAERLDAVEDRLDDLEAGLQAVRGYVGSVRAVNDDVERRANIAVAKAESIEARLASGADESGRDIDDVSGVPTTATDDLAQRQTAAAGNCPNQWLPATAEDESTARSTTTGSATDDTTAAADGDVQSSLARRLRDVL